MLRPAIVSPALGLLFLAVLATRYHASASADNTPDIGPLSSSLSDFPYDDNNRLSTHLLVYPRQCASAIESSVRHSVYGRQLRALEGGASAAVFPDWTPPPDAAASDSDLALQQCEAACLEIGTDRSLVQAVLPMFRYVGSDRPDGERFMSWLDESCQRVEFGFINYHKPEEKPEVAIFWMSPEGQKIPNRRLGWGEQKTNFIKTFLGHKFVFEDVDTGEVVMEHTVEFTGIRGIGDFPSKIHHEADKTREIRRTLVNEWDRHLKVKRTFSELGFSRGRLPDDVFASMGAFNYNNAKYRSLEEWGGKGVFVNWWERDVKFIQIPWDLRIVWQTRIKELVEAWAGCELENTSMYGLRRYEEGARLLTHVDRVTTHAASVIINVAQGNLTKPWTVEVHDHADRLHEVVMEPGDIVYYESAKCLHARNTPLMGEGAYYTNVFSHYRPVNDANWYKKDNPEGTPEPLLDVGECRLAGPPDVYSRGSVQCDDARIGPHLSPSMFTAKNGNDLFNWWERVGEVTSKQGGHDGEL